MGWLATLFARIFGRAPRTRVTGRPTSANGASSFHIWWDAPSRLQSVSAVVQIEDPPAVDRLYFFALQASFWSDQHHGGAHAGLQWNRRHPGSGAVNWGGYDAAGAILPGSPSPLPSTPNDPNTRDFAWVPGARYRLTIGPVRIDANLGPVWPARIEGLDTGEDVVIRELRCPGTHLRGPVVWSEVFADCDHPSVSVRWSEVTAVTEDGTSVPVTSGRVSYQSFDDGGCDNTSVLADAGAVLQRTSVERTTPHDARIDWQAG